MKKLIYLILFFPSLAFAQVKSDAYLNTEADTIKNESVSGKNTQKRIARMIKNIIASKINKDSAAFTLTTTGSSGAATYSGGVLNVPVYSNVLPSNANGVLKNNGSGTLSWITDLSVLNGSWTTISLPSGWSAFAGLTPQYMVDALGTVHLRGYVAINSAANSSGASKVPAPSTNRSVFSVQPYTLNGGGSVIDYLYVLIQDDGSITLNKAGGLSGAPSSIDVAFSLEGISYRTN